MPTSFRGIIVFVVTATVMFAVGSFVYARVVSPLVARFRGSVE